MISKSHSFLAALLVFLYAALAGVLVAATPSAAPPALRISSEIPLTAPALQRATDVRWAGESSVYLGLGIDGAVEVHLDKLDQAPKEMIPGRSKPGGFWGVAKIAASSRYFVGAGPALLLTWRRLDDPARVEHAFEGIQAIDARENRLAILGVRRDEQREVGKDGAIAWTGSLDKGLEDLKPILYDIGGPGAPTMDRCGLKPLGAMRFLTDGSLAVLPGTQPGVYLFGPQGKLTQTWDTASLGIDTDCLSLSEQQADALAMKPKDRHIWINRRQTVDTLLPFAEGLGLVVRRIEDGRTRWDLKLLGQNGLVETYRIPIEGNGEFFHLKGDVRGERMVFVLKEEVFMVPGDRSAPPTRPRLYLSHLPK